MPVKKMVQIGGQGNRKRMPRILSPGAVKVRERWDFPAPGGTDEDPSRYQALDAIDSPRTSSNKRLRSPCCLFPGENRTWSIYRLCDWIEKQELEK